ncbi:MAG: MEDS domain-containing protein [Chloroflexi bacterium]|nr:MEDS domain-containing protein [Chloroflexota bacterium]
MLQEKARSTGIDVLGNVSWGTHVCQFYQTKLDLLDILVPYFQEGLRNNESCMWVTSPVLTVDAAQQALRARLPDLDEYIRRGQLEVLPHTEWYMKGGTFEMGRVLAGWIERKDRAVSRGFDGLRLTGDTCWLEQRQWEDFVEYEAEVDRVLGEYPIIALCTYALDRCGANEIVDVVRNHRFALIKRGERWERIESAERRRVEALRQSEQLYRSLVNTTGAWITRFDRAGQRTLVIGADSPAFGHVSQEVLATDAGGVIVPEDREKFKGCFESVFATGKPVQGVVLRARLGGSLRYVSTSWEPVKDVRGNVSEVQFTAFDVTNQRRLEEQYHQAQKMESVGRLAGGVAHDFNNLLTVIDGYTEMALRSLPPDSPERGGLEEARTAVERAATLVRQLLTLSRRQPLEAKVVDLGDLVSNLGKLLRRVIGEDIQLSTAVAPGLWRVRVDPGQMEQVLLNLAVNARDAMPEGGKLTIEVANIGLDDSYASQHSGVAPGDYVMVAVSDTGVGMSDEVKTHLFEPFFTTKPQGTGLGLSSCYGIVKQSGGHIGVYSEPNRGTTMRVYLPRVEGVVEEATKPQGPVPRARGGETVLAVEDEPGLRKLLVMILEQLGYAVLQAANGDEALRLAKERASPVHLLLTDLVMPGMDGKELAERLKAEGLAMKVLYMSGHSDGALTHSGVLEPGTRFLQKPFTWSSLGRKVREALDG